MKIFWFTAIGFPVLYIAYLMICYPSLSVGTKVHLTIFLIQMIFALHLVLDMRRMYKQSKEIEKQKFLNKLLEDEPLQAGLKIGDEGFFSFDGVQWRRVSTIQGMKTK